MSTQTITSNLAPRLAPKYRKNRNKRMENQTDVDVTGVEDGEESEKPEFEPAVIAAITAGDIIIKDAEIKIPKETAKTDHDLVGTFKAVTFVNLKGAVAYFDGKDDEVWKALSTYATAVRKQNARQKLVADSIPEEVRKTRQAAKRLVGLPGWGDDEEAIFNRLMSPSA